MREDFTPVYAASTVAVAQKLADRFAHEGIEAFVDDTESPLYGMNLGPRTKLVHVRAPAEARAREILHDFQEEYHRRASPEELRTEPTGLELPKPQRPSDDSPNEPYNVGTERQQADPPGPDSPEIEAISGEAEGQGNIAEEDIAAIGGERSSRVPPPDESEDQPMP